MCLFSFVAINLLSIRFAMRHVVPAVVIWSAYLTARETYAYVPSFFCNSCLVSFCVPRSALTAYLLAYFFLRLIQFLIGCTPSKLCYKAHRV